MNEYSGQVKRNLNERKFNRKNSKYCATGGVINGCPFFRLNNNTKWGCTLYRLFPKPYDNGKYYERGDACLNDNEPPIKKTFILHYNVKQTCEIIAMSKKEALALFNKKYDGEIVEIVEGKEVDYEYTI